MPIRDQARNLYEKLHRVRWDVPEGDVTWTDDEIDDLLAAAEPEGRGAMAKASAARHGLREVARVVEARAGHDRFPMLPEQRDQYRAYHQFGSTALFALMDLPEPEAPVPADPMLKGFFDWLRSFGSSAR